MKLIFDGSYGPATPQPEHLVGQPGIPDWSQGVQDLGTFNGRPDIQRHLEILPQWKAQVFAAHGVDPQAFAILRNVIG